MRTLNIGFWIASALLVFGCVNSTPLGFDEGGAGNKESGGTPGAPKAGAGGAPEKPIVGPLGATAGAGATSGAAGGATSGAAGGATSGAAGAPMAGASGTLANPSAGGSGSGGGGGGGGISACACPEDTVHWDRVGGERPQSKSYQVNCHGLSLTTQVQLPAPGDPRTCQTPLTCSTAHNELGSVSEALKDPEVIKARTLGTIMYGYDNRPVDGSVLRIRIGTAEILVGDPDCSNSLSACINIPPGISRLVAALDDLQSLAPDSCEARCAAQDARRSGFCDKTAIFYWTGVRCYETVVGCACAGADCESGFASLEDCQSAHADCVGRCDAQQAAPRGTCDATEVYYWNGTTCEQHVKGCGCDGADCANGFASPGSCVTAHLDCHPAPLPCGARAGDLCLPSEYCAYEPIGQCGRGDAEATCQPRPETCDSVLSPVCGCDGKTYDSKCVAARAGTGVYSEGRCPQNG